MGGVVGVASKAEHCNALWVVVYNPQALKSHFLPFIDQERPKLDISYTILLHI